MAFDCHVKGSLLTQFYSLLSRTYFLRRPYVLIRDFKSCCDQIDASAIPGAYAKTSRNKTLIMDDDNETYAIIKGRFTLNNTDGIFN